MRDFLDIGVREVLGPGGLLAEVHPSFEPRDGQLRMAESVARAIGSGGALAVEAPTGVGKTLAYLVPALLSNKRVLVSTHTKTLQEQIIDKDIPLLERVFARVGLNLVRSGATKEPERYVRSADGARAPLPQLAPQRGSPVRRYALMKGRANYLCIERLLKRQKNLFEREGDRRALDAITLWSGRTLRGDRSELPTLEEDLPLWDELDGRAETCLGSRCPRYEDCFVVRMRREGEQADLIVVNHHLLLADLTLRAEAALSGERRALGEVIPRADVLIVDESHTLEEVASEYFGGEVSTRKLERFLRDTVSWLAEQRDLQTDALALRASEAVTLAEKTFTLLPAAAGESRVRIPPKPEAPAPDPFGRAREKAKDAAARLDGLAEAFAEHPDDPGAESLARRGKALSDGLRFVLAAADPDFVYWAERGKKSSRIGAAPIAVDDLLRAHLFEAFESVVLTSATLATGGEDFGYFLERIGAPEETTAIRLGTPFDFRRQTALYVPSPKALSPPDSPGFLEAICRIGHNLIDQLGGGALFLFTSHRMMRLAHAQLGPQLRYPVLLQGEAPKRQLLRDFVDRAPAVLFATASFWEGVDVPGDPLRLVIIDRLPFASPSDPVVAARLERLAALGEDPFHAYQVPQAILRLKQGFGRLVRRSSDRGVVAILDPRLSTKGYGRRFLAALPEATLIRDPDALAAWLTAQGMLYGAESWVEPVDEAW